MATISPEGLLLAFLGLRLAQHLAEVWLGALNHGYGRDRENQEKAATTLGISAEDMEKAAAYSTDRYRFGVVLAWADITLALGFVGLGGLGWLERWSEALAVWLGSSGSLAVGLVFFALLGLGSAIAALPAGLYRVFRIEARHGFNRQTLGGFFTDWFKGLGLGVVLGGSLLALVLWIMDNAGAWWWLLAWGVVSGFGVLTAWIYPTLLAPLFNRFSALPEGELREAILDLARRVGFRTSGVYTMDASRRSAHGNAFFAGLFGSRRIVLFDTLIEALSRVQIVAVLAHELGHFKLNHVRWRLVRSTLSTGLLLYLMSLLLEVEVVYRAFGLFEPTAYGALVTFGLWFGLVSFVLEPFEAALSQRQERAADRFAVATGSPSSDLAQALLALRERSRTLPLTHPLYARFYLSHPPLLERLSRLSGLGETPSAQDQSSR